MFKPNFDTDEYKDPANPRYYLGPDFRMNTIAGRIRLGTFPPSTPRTLLEASANDNERNFLKHFLAYFKGEVAFLRSDAADAIANGKAQASYLSQFLLLNTYPAMMQTVAGAQADRLTYMAAFDFTEGYYNAVVGVMSASWELQWPGIVAEQLAQDAIAEQALLPGTIPSAEERAAAVFAVLPHLMRDKSGVSAIRHIAFNFDQESQGKGSDRPRIPTWAASPLYAAGDRSAPELYQSQTAIIQDLPFER